MSDPGARADLFGLKADIAAEMFEVRGSFAGTEKLRLQPPLS